MKYICYFKTTLRHTTGILSVCKAIKFNLIEIWVAQRVQTNPRTSSKSESWTLAGSGINVDLVVATVIGMNCCLLLIMLAKFNNKKNTQKTKNQTARTLAVSICKEFFQLFKSLRTVFKFKNK